MIRLLTRRTLLALCLALLALAAFGMPASKAHAEDEAPQAWLGVGPDDVDDEARKELKLPADSGVLIVEVHDGSGADKAGIKVDDIITAIDGKPAPNADGFRALIASHKPGDVLELTIIRDKKEIKLKATLGKRPPE